ncbi:response regulator [Glaciecola sp. MH2013]|uniref:response regulator n=1 Tax=Glaciecola sp. MH2013 TaxID=2785524 RepID=UPI00189D110F|nr:response regulator [Glaciecola sp. MH2013]MBF7074942.1 response regulator [Glaciecola sp. MH2013]
MNNISALIIDDSEINRYILNRQLKLVGIEHIFENDDGSSALSFLSALEENMRTLKEKFPPTIIFLDINMPIVNGFDFLERFVEMAKEKAYQRCKVVIYSSSSLEEDKERALSFDCVSDYLVKGDSSLDELKLVVERLH